MRVAVLGAGLQGVCAALELADRGCQVELFERNHACITQASLWNEGKIHLGFVYANDRSLRTVKLMIIGALHFAPFLSRWISENELAALRSQSFYYAVPRDSLLSIDKVEGHFHVVKRLYREAVTCFGLDYFGVAPESLFKRLPNHDLDHKFDLELLQGGFRTAEVALDVHTIAQLLRAAVARQRRIRLRSRTVVEGILGSRSGPLQVITNGDARPNGPYDHVVNALWNDRLRIDATFGIATSRPWLYRRKVAVHIRGGPRSRITPSTTMILGPYGDVVNFGNGNYYLSWYPAGHIDSSRALSPPLHWMSPDPKLARAALRKTIAEELRRFIPGIAELNGTANNAEVEAGTIFAWGDSDIDDPDSELHQRHDIGVHSYGCYHSIDTGKYCTAPYFAGQIAETITPRSRLINYN